MPANRSAGRDVHLYNPDDLSKPLGGLVLTNGITNENFYAMVEVFVFFSSPYILRHEDVTDGLRDIPRDEQPLQPGKYYVIAEGSFVINNESWLVRAISVATGTRVGSFRDAVRERDRRCVVTGELAVNAEFDSWTGFEAAHIFPLAYEGHWKDNNYGQWITIPPASESAGTINSVQNGMLLSNNIHALFDSYEFSINPDDNYKIVCFMRDGKGIAGKHLDQQFVEDPQRPVDQLLRWHFRQAVFANMRGAGEPVFEFDFPPGSDMMGEILSGPKAGERMEFELFSRLVDY